MSLLPIVARELRVRSRRRATYLLRMAAAILACLVGGSMLFIGGLAGTGARMGSVLLITLSWMTLLYCYLDGIRNAADSLSEEKREGTLGLLFLTDLRGYDVVLGKFAAASLNSFYGLLAILPILALSLLLGGVTGGQFWRVALTLINTLFFVVAAALLVSAASRQHAEAWARSLALTLVITAAGPILGAISGLLLTLATKIQWLGLPATRPIVELFDILALASPLTTFGKALSTGAPSRDFWWSLAGVHGVAWSFLALASFVLPRAWQDRPPKTRATSGLMKARMDPAVEAQRLSKRQRLMAISPVVWLAMRYQRRPYIIYLTVACAAVVVILGFGTDATPYFLLPFFLAAKFGVTVQACRVFSEARQSGALELLLSTPLTARDIVYGQLRAILRLYFWPLLLLLGLRIVATAGAMGPYGNDIFLILKIAYDALGFVTNILALVFFGMWMALTLRRPNQAVGLTLLCVLVLPEIVFCFPGIIFDLVFIFWSRSEMEQKVRGLGIPAAPRRDRAAGF